MESPNDFFPFYFYLFYCHFILDSVIFPNVWQILSTSRKFHEIEDLCLAG